MSIQLRVRTAFVLCGVTLAVCVGSLTAQPTTAGESEKLLAEVKAAWEKREAATKTVRMSWSMQTMTPKGAVTLQFPPHVTEGKTYPPKDVTHNGKATVLFSGADVRYTSEEHQWAQLGADFTLVRLDTAVNQEKSTTLRRYGNQTWPSGLINKAKSVDGFDVTTWPARVAFRGTSSVIMNRIALAYYSGARAVVADGHSLIELTRPRTERLGEAVLWLDPKKEYSVVRYEVRSPSGVLQQRTRVSSVRDRSGVWVPSAWSVLVYDDTTLLRSTTATVTECVVNLAVSAADFEVSFPPGTRVFESLEGKPREYILRENRPPREILPNELAAPYEDLARTEAGELNAEVRASYLARNWFWLSSIILAVTVALLVRRHRIRSLQRVPTNPTTEV